MRTIEVAGTRISAIGLGCWQFGSKEWGYGDWFAGVPVGRMTTPSSSIPSSVLIQTISSVQVATWLTSCYV